MHKRIACPLCFSKNTYEIKYRLDKGNICECSGCGLISRGEVFSVSELENIYAENYFTVQQKDYFSAGMTQDLSTSLKANDFKQRLDEINASRNNSKGKLLDIGCATGIFLKIVKDNGWKTQGVEMSHFARKIATNKFKLKVFEGELKQAKFQERYFDVVTAWDLVEHAEDPYSLLIEVRRILKPGGLLVMQTTRTDSLLFNIADIVYRWSGGKVVRLVEMAYPIHHAHSFSKTTLTKLVEKTGFKVVKFENKEMWYEETSLPKWSLPFLKIFKILSTITGKTIEMRVLATTS